MSSSVILKVLEYCILFEVKPFVDLNDRHHGFRETYSTTTVCLVLKETIFEYCNQNSKVYSCFLDFSKAFDYVNHAVLINKLGDLGIPLLYVNLIKYWNSNQFAKVRFNGRYSKEWRICNGVRQGGVLSGLLFCVYVDNLLNKVSKLKIGCKLGLHASNIIAYADDIVLLAPSSTSLQILMDHVYKEAVKLELSFNADKCKLMIFDFNRKRCHNITKQFLLGGQPILEVTSTKYLGFQIRHNLCSSEDITIKRGKFYSEFNQILRKFNETDQDIKLILFKQFCLQIYGAELWFGACGYKSNLKEFSVAYHKAIKKIIGLSYHESNHYV